MKASLILAAVCLLSLVFPKLGQRFLSDVEEFLKRIAGRRSMYAFIVVGVLAGSIALLTLYRLPQPRIHDEFAYLLQGDTFAHGRLTNPTHPMARFFETFHVLQQPTYNAKYQPGQGMFLALGQVVSAPIIGVWISTALGIAALFWMLRALFAPGWALAGALLAFSNAQLLWWNWSFWGGSVPLLGGALVLGGAFRLMNEPTALASAAMGVGAGVLTITRPFEGLALCCVAGAVCVWSFWKKRPAKITSRFVTPLLCAVIPFLAFTSFYNYRVTGSALTPPYTLYEKTHSRSALFIWQADPQSDRNYRPEINRFYDGEKRDADQQRSLPGFMRGLWPKIKLYDRYFLHGLIALALIPALFFDRRRPILLCFAMFVLLFGITLGSSFWAQPHYSAPIFPLLIALVLFGFQTLHARLKTRFLAQSLFITLCLLGVVMFASRLWKDQKSQWQYKRADLIAHFDGSQKKQLVLVKYSAQHDPKVEWIYNRADIDAAHAVFAPDGSPEEIAPLLKYFKGYDVLHIEPDRQYPDE
jgi:MFS family permease